VQNAKRTSEFPSHAKKPRSQLRDDKALRVENAFYREAIVSGADDNPEKIRFKDLETPTRGPAQQAGGSNGRKYSDNEESASALRQRLHRLQETDERAV
jgi:hypothetical protein